MKTGWNDAICLRTLSPSPPWITIHYQSLLSYDHQCKSPGMSCCSTSTRMWARKLNSAQVKSPVHVATNSVKVSQWYLLEQEAKLPWIKYCKLETKATTTNPQNDKKKQNIDYLTQSLFATTRPQRTKCHVCYVLLLTIALLLRAET